jgi:uncharacterized membrane protein
MALDREFSNGPARREDHAPAGVAVLLLAMSAGLSLFWSHARLMWMDEFFSFYTDAMPTFRDVLRVQLHYPLSVDPPTFHLAAHLCMLLLGRSGMVLRLPALLGFLTFQACLYVFVRRIAGGRAGLIALVLPAMTGGFLYSLEGRPYGLLLGFYGLALVCWQSATRRELSGEGRWLALTGFAMALAAGSTTHYFGVLIVIPFYAVEAVRLFDRKRFDRGLLTALILGSLGVLGDLPFQGTAKQYREHYYMRDFSWRVIPDTYRVILQNGQWPPMGHTLAIAILIVFTLAIVVGGWRRFRGGELRAPGYDWVVLVVMGLMPFLCFLLAKFVTHIVEPRYALPVLFAYAAALGISLQPYLRRNAVFYVVLGCMAATAIVFQVHNAVVERRSAAAFLAQLTIQPEVQAALKADPNSPIYVQQVYWFYLYAYYLPDANLRRRITLVGGPEDLHWTGYDTMYIETVNLQRLDTLPVCSYASLLRQSAPLLVEHPQSPGEWIDMDLNSRGLTTTTIGPLGAGTLVRVNTHPKTAGPGGEETTPCTM